MDFASFLTDFADQAVVLPLAAGAAIGLLLMGWLRGAVVWTLAVAGVLGVMLGLKVVFAACGPPPGFSDFHSPSGHTAAAEMVYGGLAALFVKRLRGALPAMSAGALIAAVVGATRLILGIHTLVEVVVGSLVGMLGILSLVRFAGPPPGSVRWGRLGAAGVLLVVVFHGVHLGAEPVIDRWALHYFWPLSACER